VAFDIHICVVCNVDYDFLDCSTGEVRLGSVLTAYWVAAVVAYAQSLAAEREMSGHGANICFGNNLVINVEFQWAMRFVVLAHSCLGEFDSNNVLARGGRSGADSLRRFLENHPLMKQTPAVKQQRYLKLQYAELTPGPANINAAEKLAHALYPAANQ